MPKSLESHVGYSTTTRLDNQLGEISPYSYTTGDISRPSFRYSVGDCQPCREVPTEIYRVSSDSKVDNSHVGQKSFEYPESNNARSPSYSSRPHASSTPPILACKQMESSFSRLGQAGSDQRFLSKSPQLVCQSKNSRGCPSVSTDNRDSNLHRCVNKGVGSLLGGETTVRDVASSTQIMPHQFLGDASSPSHNPSLGIVTQEQGCHSVLRQLDNRILSPEGRGDEVEITFGQNSRNIDPARSLCHISPSNSPSGSQERQSRCSITSRTHQCDGVVPGLRGKRQTVLCIRNSNDRSLCHLRKQGDTSLCFALPGSQSLGDRRPITGLGQFRVGLPISSNGSSTQSHRKDPISQRDDFSSDSIPEPLQVMASGSSRTEHSNQDRSISGNCPIPIPTGPSLPRDTSGSGPVLSRRLALMRSALLDQGFSQDSTDLMIQNIRKSSSHVYDAQWNQFETWLKEKGTLPQHTTFQLLADYLTYLFHKGLAVSTIKLHRSAISSVLRLLRPPHVSEEDALAKLIRAMSIQRPKTRRISPAWNLGLVLRQLMLPPFTYKGSDKKISLELLTKKTVFLVALASSARASEICAFSRAPHNISFDTATSGQISVTIHPFAGFFPKNVTPETVPVPNTFPGLAHLFPKEPERLICPVRALSLYLTKTEKLSKDCKLFVHWKPETQIRTSHLSKWLVDTIKIAYDHSTEDTRRLESVKGHQVRSLSTSWAYFSKVSLQDIRDSVGWRSHSVFSSHYLRDVSNDVGDCTTPLVAAGKVVNL